MPGFTQECVLETAGAVSFRKALIGSSNTDDADASMRRAAIRADRPDVIDQIRLTWTNAPPALGQRILDHFAANPSPFRLRLPNGTDLFASYLSAPALTRASRLAWNVSVELEQAFDVD